jgi:hypothetical protein
MSSEAEVLAAAEHWRAGTSYAQCPDDWAECRDAWKLADAAIAAGMFQADDECRADWEWALSNGATAIPRDEPNQMSGVEWKNRYGVSVVSLGWREQLLCGREEVMVAGAFPTRGDVRALLRALKIGGAA